MAEPLRLGRVGFLNSIPSSGASTRQLDAGRPRRSPASRPRSTGCCPRARSTWPTSPRSSTPATRSATCCCRRCASAPRARSTRCSWSPKPLDQVRTVAATPRAQRPWCSRGCCCGDVEIRGEDARPTRRMLIGDAALHPRSGSHAALRPRPAVARAHRPADGVRRVGGPRESASSALLELERALRRGAGRRARQRRAAWPARERPLRLAAGLPGPLLRAAALPLRPARAAGAAAFFELAHRPACSTGPRAALRRYGR